MSGFTVQNVSKIYDGDLPTTTLQNINLQVRDGEFLCILGPSGCGKSTLLELLAGLQAPTEGEILLDDVPVKGPTRQSGVVFQDASLYPWRNIAQNVGLGLEIGGMNKAERQELVHKYLNMVGLEGFGSKYPHHLSGGMRQRAGIARALVGSLRFCSWTSRSGRSIILQDFSFSKICFAYGRKSRRRLCL